MRENKEVIERGETNLKQCEGARLIIHETDSVLIKKRKIRGIKLKASTFILTKKSLTDDLLAYTNVYEMVCEMIVQQGLE